MNRQLSHQETQWQQRQHAIVVVCDNWRVPENVGMAFRLADAFGVEQLLLGGTTPVPPNRKIAKAARSTDKWVPYARCESLVAAMLAHRSRGYHLVGVEITDSSLPIGSLRQQLPPTTPTLLVLGAESGGISGDVLPLLDACVHIPMFGKNTSLNVATALSIALYEWTRPC